MDRTNDNYQTEDISVEFTLQLGQSSETNSNARYASRRRRTSSSRRKYEEYVSRHQCDDSSSSSSNGMTNEKQHHMTSSVVDKHANAYDASVEKWSYISNGFSNSDSSNASSYPYERLEDYSSNGATSTDELSSSNGTSMTSQQNTYDHHTTRDDLWYKTQIDLDKSKMLTFAQNNCDGLSHTTVVANANKGQCAPVVEEYYNAIVDIKHGGASQMKHIKTKRSHSASLCHLADNLSVRRKSESQISRSRMASVPHQSSSSSSTILRSEPSNSAMKQLMGRISAGQCDLSSADGMNVHKDISNTFVENAPVLSQTFGCNDTSYNTDEHKNILINNKTALDRLMDKLHDSSSDMSLAGTMTSSPPSESSSSPFADVSGNETDVSGVFTDSSDYSSYLNISAPLSKICEQLSDIDSSLDQFYMPELPTLPALDRQANTKAKSAEVDTALSKLLHRVNCLSVDSKM